jgi:hypothetical protein
MHATSKTNAGGRKEAKENETGSSRGMSKIWTVFTVVSVSWIVVHGSSVISFQMEARRLNYPVNELSDLWIMVVALIVITGLRMLITSFTSDRIRRRQLLVDPAAGEVKIDKSIRAFVGIVWYAFCIVECSYSRATASTSSQAMNTCPRCYLEDVNAMSCYQNGHIGQPHKMSRFTT